MVKKNRNLVWVLCVPLLLFGCGTIDEQSDDLPAQAESVYSQSEKPPELELEIDGETIRTSRSSYSWSYYDKEEATTAGVEASSIPPNEMVDMKLARKVDKNAEVALNFGEAPLSYKVYVWDETGNSREIPGTFDLLKYEGETIFEIRADWEQGDGGYVFALDVE